MADRDKADIDVGNERSRAETKHRGGRGSDVEMDNPPETGAMADQLAIVQAMVQEMKAGFVSVLEELDKIQDGDQTLQQQVAANRSDYTEKVNRLTAVVEELKGEIKAISEKLDSYKADRDLLLDELVTTHAISAHTRQKFHSGLRTAPPHDDRVQSGDGSVDCDSGINGTPHEDSPLYEPDESPQINPLVQPYIASLQKSQFSCQSDSDSSVTAAATKGLNITFNLRDRLMDMDQSDGSDDDDERNQHNSSSEGSGYLTLDMINQRRVTTGRKIPPHEKPMKDTRRHQLCLEILESERLYCSTLWTLIDAYMNPLQQSGLLTPRELGILFPTYLTRLYEQHCTILRKLEERLNNWQYNGVIGDIFAKYLNTEESDLLMLYKDYANQIPRALNCLNKWYSQSPQFKQFIKSLKQNPSSQGVNFSTLLLAPAQRIHNYTPMIKVLMTHTEPEHADMYCLEGTLSRLMSFLTVVNEEMEEAVDSHNRRGAARSRRHDPLIKSNGYTNNIAVDRDGRQKNYRDDNMEHAQRFDLLLHDRQSDMFEREAPDRRLSGMFKQRPSAVSQPDLGQMRGPAYMHQTSSTPENERHISMINGKRVVNRRQSSGALPHRTVYEQDAHRSYTPRSEAGGDEVRVRGKGRNRRLRQRPMSVMGTGQETDHYAGQKQAEWSYRPQSAIPHGGHFDSRKTNYKKILVSADATQRRDVPPHVQHLVTPLDLTAIELCANSEEGPNSYRSQLSDMSHEYNSRQDIDSLPPAAEDYGIYGEEEEEGLDDSYDYNEDHYQYGMQKAKSSGDIALHDISEISQEQLAASLAVSLTESDRGDHNTNITVNLIENTNNAVNVAKNTNNMATFSERLTANKAVNGMDNHASDREMNHSRSPEPSSHQKAYNSKQIMPDSSSIHSSRSAQSDSSRKTDPGQSSRNLPAYRSAEIVDDNTEQLTVIRRPRSQTAPPPPTGTKLSVPVHVPSSPQPTGTNSVHRQNESAVRSPPTVQDQIGSPVKPASDVKKLRKDKQKLSTSNLSKSTDDITKVRRKSTLKDTFKNIFSPRKGSTKMSAMTASSSDLNMEPQAVVDIDFEDCTKPDPQQTVTISKREEMEYLGSV